MHEHRTIKESVVGSVSIRTVLLEDGSYVTKVRGSTADKRVSSCDEALLNHHLAEQHAYATQHEAQFANCPSCGDGKR